MKVSESLRDAIVRSGESLAALAKATGVDKGQLSRFVRSKQSLTLDTVDRLAACLGWPHQALDESRIAPDYGLLTVGKLGKKARVCRVTFQDAQKSDFPFELPFDTGFPSHFELEAISPPMGWRQAYEKMMRCKLATEGGC